MWSLTQAVRLSLIVLLVAGFGVSASAALPPEALDAYVKAYTAMGKSAALIYNNRNTLVNARTGMITAVADAQAKLINARAAWITAVATARANDAKTLETLQQVRSLAMDNAVKCAKTYYDKRKSCEDYKAAHPINRCTQEDLIRYSKASLPQRPGNYQVGGRIGWPECLEHEDFFDCRVRMESLFAQRKSVPGSDVSHQVQTVALQMREQLRSKVREMNPSEYIAARKFLDSLAYEARFSANIEGVAAN